MRPERRGPDRPFHGGLGRHARSPLPFEPVDDAAASAVAQVQQALTDAGRKARAETSAAERPDPEFAAALRERLLIQLPAGATIADPATAPDPRRVAPRFEGGAVGTRSPRTIVIPPAEPAGAAPARLGFVASPPMANAGRPQRVVSRLAWTGPRVATAPRWAAALVAAVLVVAAIGIGPGRGLFSSPAPSHATDVAGASLLRDGAVTTLTDGTELKPGDEVRTAAGGHVTLVLGGSLARLDGGTDVVVQSLTGDRIALDQAAGRVYHRVAVPSGGSYAVTTAGITWTARGTAFDLDRSTDPAGGTDLALLAVQHGVTVDGPGISATIAEGRRAEIVLAGGSSAPDLSTGTATGVELHDPWLAANARLDAAAGFDPGVLVALLATEPPPASPAPVTPEPAAPEPTDAGPTSQPSADPGATTEPGATPPSTPAPADTARPTPKETPKPTPKETTSPVADLALSARACPGGTVLEWSAAAADGFHHYKTYWSGSASFSGSAIVDGSSTTNRTATSTIDAAASGARWYRTYAYNAAGQIVARSPIREAAGQGGPSSLGALGVGPAGPDTTYSWPEMAIVDGCYSATKLVYAADGEPGFGQPGTTLLWWTGDATVHAVPSQTTPAGTWWFRVQVLVETALRTVVTAETTPVQYSVP